MSKFTEFVNENYYPIYYTQNGKFYAATNLKGTAQGRMRPSQNRLLKNINKYYFLNKEPYQNNNNYENAYNDNYAWLSVQLNTIANLRKKLGIRNPTSLWREQAKSRNVKHRPVRAAKVIQRAFRHLYYAPPSPNNSPRPWIHGRGYRKAIARVRGRSVSPAKSPKSRKMDTLRAKLVILKSVKNRGAMMNVYNSMKKNWEATGSRPNGVNILKEARQLIQKVRS